MTEELAPWLSVKERAATGVSGTPLEYFVDGAETRPVQLVPVQQEHASDERDAN